MSKYMGLEIQEGLRGIPMNGITMVQKGDG